MAGPVRFVALGDSLTEGVGDPVADGWRGWAAVLARSLAPAGAGVEFTNLARSGALSADLTAGQLPVALALRPAVAAVVIGGNDTLRAGFDVGRTARELDATLGGLSRGGALVLTACLPDPGTLLRLPQPFARPLARRMRAVNTVVHALSARHRTVHLHLAELPWMARRQLLSVDRLHPSAEGHHLIARGFHDLLAAAGRPLGPAPAAEPAEPPPGTLADLWWMATRGTRWVADRSTDLLPGLLALAAVEGFARLRGATGRQDEQMVRAAAAALASLGPAGAGDPSAGRRKLPS
ncbi:SGNH/GDSL hydrolase family protein [Streptomyces sp. CB01881]|uniref:SGNH/GDSL hydrolase family protein n=1 Tax=Streptomyces sp. CB01881 TaxID=2078691 RepID=UPI000CDC7F0C|nr:SGNH/GDSL hydrolase family protein [Streptomyces sp. CB01881]AUY48554.1 lipase [Streptomyces sp. CB01881]TYC77044.1 SGNH/GDSL hydrolase family protein [Streptomyces sp. CB01881]